MDIQKMFYVAKVLARGPEVAREPRKVFRM